MTKQTYTNSFDNTEKYGVFLNKLTEEQTQKLEGEVASFLKLTDTALNQNADFHKLADNISTIGQDALKVNNNATLNNEIIQRLKVYSQEDGEYNKAMKSYQSTLANMDVVRKWEEGGFIKRQMVSLPIVRNITKKIIETKHNAQSGGEFMQNLNETFQNEKATLENDKQSLIKQKENIYDTLKKLQEINYVLESLKKQALEISEVLKNSGDSEKQAQGELIYTYIYSPAVERHNTMQQIVLTNLSAYQTNLALLNSVDTFKKAIIKTEEVAIPAIQLGLLSNAFAESQAKTLTIIEQTNQLADLATTNVVKQIASNQERVHKLHANNIVDASRIIAASKTLEDLRKKDIEFFAAQTKRLEEETAKLAPQLEQQFKRINAIENLDVEIREGLEYVAAEQQKSQEQEDKIIKTDN